uniref:Uncharacterized protein n=1 Tax=Pundamilia nyererei TaxID=303518 RepID=A0A3B4F4T7_9CICH
MFSSSVRSSLASNAIGNQCKSKKPLSAAKACIPQILPSKFKPRLLPPCGNSKDSRTKDARHPKAHSCEDIYTGQCDTDCAEAEAQHSDSRSSCGSECGDGLRNVSPAIRRSASDFSSLYRTMHHIQRPSSTGCSPHGSVRSLTSLFEKPKDNGDERSEADDGGSIPRDTVSSRVNEFEMIIQRSTSAPSRSSSLPILHSSHSHSPSHSPAHLYMASAVSAESLLLSPSVMLTASPPQHSHLHHHHHHHHLLHHLNNQLLLKPSKCKGSCPASYTRFTTILRHERQQATNQQEKQPPTEKKTTLPGNLFLMGPAPFRLRKNPQSHQTRRMLLATRVPAGTQRPISLSPELRPSIPQRLSSLEVLERLSNGEENNTGYLSNGQGLDTNGNLLQPLAAHRRGGYLHPFTTCHPPSLCGLSFILTLSSPCVPFLHKAMPPPSISSLCGVFTK